MLVYSIICLNVFVFTYLGVEAYRRWCIKKNVLDIPNERSSHQLPTPSGGGIIIFLAVFIAVIGYFFYTKNTLFSGYLCASLIIVIISYLDDVWEISPFTRFGFQILAALITVLFVGGFDNIGFLFFDLDNLKITGKILAFLWIVCLINSYNFMDGIDGIAALQAIIAGIGWCIIGWLTDMLSVFYLSGVLTFAAAGFYFHNKSPAKIFMGDTGSAFLGYSFAVLPLLAIKETSDVNIKSKSIWLGISFLWLFVFDPSYTGIKRILRGEKLWIGHRTHYYQKLVAAKFKDSTVAVIYGISSAILITAGIFCLTKNRYFYIIVFGTAILESIILVRITKRKSVNQSSKIV